MTDPTLPTLSVPLYCTWCQHPHPHLAQVGEHWLCPNCWVSDEAKALRRERDEKGED
jgi:hypothetical protein